MKTYYLLLILLMFGAGCATAQKSITVNASDYDISDNLDLKAVAYLFGESKNLEEFERKLNDPKLAVSNLDLNSDGYIDYLRVIEVKQGKVFVITIQAVLGKDIYQDIATIDVEFKNKKTVYVQVVGNEYIYGYNYIVEPVYVHRPVIYNYLWHPRQVVWVSPWYYGYYPVYYRPLPPRTVYVYHHHVHKHYHPRVHCRYVPHRKIHTAVVIHKHVQRDDWAKSKPEKSFSERNNGIDNHRQLTERRSTRPNVGTTTTKSVETQGRRVETVTAPQSPARRSTQVNGTRSSVPAASQPKSVTIEKNAPASRSNTPSVGVRQPAASSSTRNEVRSTPAQRSETRQAAPQRNEARQAAPAQRQSQSANVRTATPQNKSANVAKPATNTGKNETTERRTSNSKTDDKNEQRTASSSRR